MGQEFIDILVKQAALGWLCKDEDWPLPLRMGKSRMMAIKCTTDRVSRHRDGHGTSIGRARADNPERCCFVTREYWNID
jgi:hypothetical protein